MVDSKLRKLYQQISRLKSLKPSTKVSELFNSLVLMALNDKHIEGLTSVELQRLQRICAKAEYELEKFWAGKIIDSSDPPAMLEKFPYLKNYQKLTKLEWHSLMSCAEHDTHKILFCGGGPLPLTAIILALQYSQSITVLENDAEACQISKDVITKLELSNMINIVLANAADYAGYQNFNAIFVAALAGIRKNTKAKILENIKRTSVQGSHILVRSSWGNRELLYKPVFKTEYQGFSLDLEVRPSSDVINSILIFSSGVK